jgi:hypothetical protein
MMHPNTQMHPTLVTNNKEYWMKKINNIQIHPLIPLYTYY